MRMMEVLMECVMGVQVVRMMGVQVVPGMGGGMLSAQQLAHYAHLMGAGTRQKHMRLTGTLALKMMAHPGCPTLAPEMMAHPGSPTSPPKLQVKQKLRAAAAHGVLSCMLPVPGSFQNQMERISRMRAPTTSH